MIKIAFLILGFVFLFQINVYTESTKKETTITRKKTTIVKKNKSSQKDTSEKEKNEKKKKSTSDKEKAEKIEKTIKYGTHKEQKQAMIYIPTIKEEKYKKKLEKLLIKLIEEEKEPTVIIKAITICEELQLKEALPVILKKLNHKSEDVKIAVVSACKKFKYTTTKPVLIELLKKQDFTKNSNLTIAIINTLAEFKATELKDFAIKKIEDNSTTTSLRHQLILFLGRSGASASKNFLLKRFKDPDEEIVIRSYAVNSLSKFNDKSVTPEISKIVKEINLYPVNKRKEYYSLYMYSITALARLGDPEAYPLLINSLKSNNATVRKKSIELLEDLKDKRAIEILRYKAELDQNVKVRNAAKKALKTLGIDLDKEKYPEIVKELKNKNPEKRINAIRKLKEIKDKRAIDNLKELAANDRNIRVRNEAKKAIRTIENTLKEESSKKQEK